MKKIKLNYLFVFMAIFLLTEKSIAQSKINFTKVVKSDKDAIKYEKEINELKEVLIKKFILKANNTTDTLNKQIQSYLDDYRIVNTDLNLFNYPKKIDNSNLTISVTGYDHSWGSLPNSKSDTLIDVNTYSSLNAIITIPCFQTYHRGYSLNTISFYCTFDKNEEWTESNSNTIPIKKLPSYKISYELNIKLLELND